MGGSFTYDGNGNELTDSRRAVTLTYNQLNLPATVMAGIRSATYLYDANGTKLKSVQTADGVTTTREYISGIQYTNGAIDFIQADEGMAVRNAGNGTYKYQYNLKDHLGNTRVSIDDNGSGTAEITQEDEYYAFGLDVPKFRLTTENKYLYNGKEKQDVLTDELDYGARFYDPVIARWTSVDPLAEKMRRFSPYSYGSDNPISRVDPDGMFDKYYNYGGQEVYDDHQGDGVRLITNDALAGSIAQSINSNSDLVNTLHSNSDVLNVQSDASVTQTVNDIYAKSSKVEAAAPIVLDTKAKTLGFGDVSTVGSTNNSSKLTATSFPGGDPSTGLTGSNLTIPGSGGTKVIIGQAHGHPPGSANGVSEEPNSNNGCDKCSAKNLGIPIYAVDKKNVHKVDQKGNVSNNQDKNKNIVKDALNTFNQ